MKNTINKIMVVGCCGTGKSTLAFKLRDHFKLPLYHMDKLFWKFGWKESETDEYRAKHQKIIEQPRWIIDGNFRSTMNERLEQADLVICMDMPRWRCMWGILKRRIQHHGKSRPDMTEGCVERLDWEFTKYVWNFNRDHRPGLIENLEQIKNEKPIHRVTSRKQADELIKILT